MPGTPVPFGFSKGNINNNNSENQLSGQQNNLDVKKALVAFKEHFKSFGVEQRRNRGRGRKNV